MYNQIIQHELKYFSMFSTIKKYKFGYEAEDLNQRDKYYHNQLHLLNNQFTDDDINSYFLRNKQHGFVIYRVEGNLETSQIISSDDVVDKDAIYGNYIDRIHISLKRDIETKVVDPSKDDKFFDFMYEDSKAFGESYALGNIKRQKKILDEYKDVYFYLQVIHDNQVVGGVNAFIENDIAKIDDFEINSNLHRQGFGSALMHQLLKQLKTKGVKYVYLVTDYNDTPKDMYQSWGFEFISDYFVIRKTIK